MIHHLLRQTKRYRLFQSVRLLELARYRTRDTEPGAETREFRVGYDAVPEQEAVSFGAVPISRYAGAEIDEIQELSATRKTTHAPRYQIKTTVMGLTGPQGALPRHYTTSLLARIKLRDYSMADFFDLFNHRALSLFYRAWAKHHLPIEYEAARLDQNRVDKVTALLDCLVGQGTPGLKQRSENSDETYLQFAGLFSSRRRTAAGLAKILEQTFKIPVQVKQFQQQWLNLDLEERTRLSSRQDALDQRTEANNVLGRTAICGERVSDIQGRFRIVLRTARYQEWEVFLPNQQALHDLFELTRRYVRMEHDFDVQVELAGSEVPPLQLGNQSQVKARLGWNCWLKSKPLTGLMGDAVFAVAENR